METTLHVSLAFELMAVQLASLDSEVHSELGLRLPVAGLYRHFLGVSL